MSLTIYKIYCIDSENRLQNRHVIVIFNANIQSISAEESVGQFRDALKLRTTSKKNIDRAWIELKKKFSPATDYFDVKHTLARFGISLDAD